MEKMVRVHRVGSVTTGLAMIGYGVLFLLQNFGGIVNYTVILHLWPLIPICLGVELLLSNALTQHLVYDKGAVVLLILMSALAVGMAATDCVIRIVTACQG